MYLKVQADICEYMKIPRRAASCTCCARYHLQVRADSGKIDLADAADEYEELTKKEKALHESFVRQAHVRHDGSSRIIKHHLPTDKNPRNYWVTIMEDGKRIYDATYEGLIEHLYSYYTGARADYSVRAIFESALHEKAITENPSSNSVDRYEHDFLRFISDDFASKDIRKVDSVYLKSYTQNWVDSKHPKKKVFLAYKGILNMIFRYAKAEGIILDNPVMSLNNKAYLKSCDTTKPKPEEKILAPEEIDRIREEVRRRMQMKKYGRYYVQGFAVLFAIETGVRVGELCALKWEDVHEDRIHIHSQLLRHKDDGRWTYYLVTSTKNEKGVSNDGRDFPLTDSLAKLLDEVRALQTEMGIESEFIFCQKDGRWMPSDSYRGFFNKLCKRLGFKVTNTHTIRMSFNSNVLLPMGISVADRAALLGHSIETNINHYSYADKNYLENVRERLNAGLDSVK